MMKARIVALLAVVLLATGQGSAAAADIRQERIHFKPGTTSTTIEGRIKGAETVDYILSARQGQTMNVSLATDNRANYFNILAPGDSEAALFNSSTGENQFERTLPTTGDYTVRVYLMRSAARRNEVANYRLEMIISGSPAGVAPATDAKVAGTPYHATGTVPCSVGTDPRGSAQCSFGVIRGAPGNAEVRLAPPGYDVTLHEDQVDTVLTFTGNTVASAKPGDTVSARKQDDTWAIGINDFRFFTIPDAVIVGG